MTIWLEKKWKFIVYGTPILILLGGVIYSVYLGDELRFPDEKEYVVLANNLATQGMYSMDGIQSTAYRPPGYPIMLALLRFIGGETLAYRMLNFFILAFAALMIGTQLSERVSGLAGSLSAIMLLGYPALFYMAGTLYPQTLQLLLMASLVLYGTRANLRTRDFILIGFLAAWCFLTVPTTILVILTLGAYWLIIRAKIADIIACLLIFTAITGGWSARSSIVMQETVLISTNSGINLLLGNSPNTTPNAGTTVDISHYSIHATELNEVEQDRYYRDQALKYIRENPAKAAKLFLLKALNYFNYRNELATKDEMSMSKDILMAMTYYPLLFLALARLALSKKFPLSPLEIIALAIYFTNAFLGAVFFHRVRFRLPYDVLPVISAASLLADYCTHFSYKSKNIKRNE